MVDEFIIEKANELMEKNIQDFEEAKRKHLVMALDFN